MHSIPTAPARRHRWFALLTALIALVVLAPAATAGATEADGDDHPLERYIDAIDNVEAMVWDQRVIDLAAEHGLDVVNVAWEDTGRYDDSSVGPNISDVTIQVPRPILGTDEHTLSLMPVIRFPNFTDLTGDVPIGDVTIPVGNHDGSELFAVTLEEYLGNIGDYLAVPGADRDLDLLAERDSHVLVIAQAAFLPVPHRGEATFNPVIFNYQSYAGNPAVLTIVVTSEGTSATIIDNERDGFGSGGAWGQRLFFNVDGDRASFTATRASEVEAGDHSNDAEAGFAPDGDTRATTVEPGHGSNAVLIIQVPLVHESFDRFVTLDDCFDCNAAAEAEAAPMSDVEEAIIGHGEIEGPFTELDGLRIERDPDFPVRVTVQFYQATATGEVTADDINRIAADIEAVYDDASFVGSLVTDGLVGRPTEYDGDHIEPDGWWAGFFDQLRRELPGLFG